MKSEPNPPSPPDGNLLMVFVKAPRPGAVKTRLSKTIGDRNACLAYRCLVETQLETLSEINNVELHFCPSDAKQEIEPWKRSHWPLVAQSEGDLGPRMRTAFEGAFARGFERVVCIGSDCVDLSPIDIEMAWHSLRSKDVVLGPSVDGGYWLIGMCRLHLDLFQEIPWSTSQVFSITLDRVHRLGLSHQLLATREDVDTESDWLRALENMPSLKYRFDGMKA